VVRRLPSPRLYELLLLADFALVVVLLRLKARLGLDTGRTLLDMREFLLWAGMFVLGGGAEGPGCMPSSSGHDPSPISSASSSS